MKKLSIELPIDTFEWISQEAERQHRSVAGQVRFFLDQVCPTKADTEETAVKAESEVSQ